MGNSRLFWRLFAIPVALMIAIAGFAWVVLSHGERRAALDRLEHSLAAEARFLATAGQWTASTRRDAGAVAAIKRLADQTSRRITVFEDDGTAIVDSLRDASSLENARNRPEMLDARIHDYGVATDVDSATQTVSLAVVVRVPAESGGGFIRLSEPLTGVDAAVAALRRRIVWTALLSGTVGLALTAFVMARITRPLEALSAAALAVAEGEAPVDAERWPQDEIGALAAAFRLMSAKQAARIAELQETGRQLEERGELLRTVLGGMIEGVLAVDPSERIVFANQAARYLLDLTESSDIGRPIWEAVRIPKLCEVVADALAGRENASVEFPMPRSQAIVAVLASRLPGAPCPGVVLVLHDITDLRRLENLRTEFASNVSHELKTPLTSIQAYTETLLDGAVDDPVHNRPFLQRIAEQADRLQKLIVDLLQLSQIESGRDVFEVVAVPVDKVVHACVDAHAAVARAKGLSLTTEPPKENVRVRADVGGLRTILDNLVDNAIKYTPDNGRVTVRWRTEGGAAQIEVDDTGLGIEASHLGRIFERFYRVDKARSREAGGTGLGLSIVKHLAEVFDGRVDVVSEPGHGSRFTVRLPLAG